MTRLQGRKTYIIVALGAVVFILSRLGVLVPEVETNIYTALGILGVGTLRAAIK